MISLRLKRQGRPLRRILSVKALRRSRCRERRALSCAAFVGPQRLKGGNDLRVPARTPVPPGRRRQRRGPACRALGAAGEPGSRASRVLTGGPASPHSPTSRGRQPRPSEADPEPDPPVTTWVRSFPVVAVAGSMPRTAAAPPELLRGSGPVSPRNLLPG